MEPMEVKEKTPLSWPVGWSRTRIDARKKNAAWKKNFSEARAALLKELGRMSVGDLAIGEVVISYNAGHDEARRDPGVAVYFAKYRKPDYSWIEGLGLDTPVPTRQEIDESFREKAVTCHPDRFPDDPEKAELFKRLTIYRQRALDWIRGTEKKEHEYAIPCDKFDEPRLNLMALRSAIVAFRTLERVGSPQILEHSFRGLRTALPEYKEGTDGTTTS